MDFGFSFLGRLSIGFCHGGGDFRLETIVELACLPLLSLGLSLISYASRFGVIDLMCLFPFSKDLSRVLFPCALEILHKSSFLSILVSIFFFLFSLGLL